ncbi:MAG: reverse transcriptase domain-containing protein [Ktedonobacteraceae bacterium]
MNEWKTPGNQRRPQAPTPANQPGDSVPWRALEQQVARLQTSIFQASQRGDTPAMHAAQQRLLASEAARLLAVRRVTQENQGKDTAGVDGVKSLSPRERLTMAASIHPAYWHTQSPLPVRRVWVPKPGTLERRPLAILPMIDRCKQALVKLALEPEWEARFEPHSYGFRPERGTQDAIRAILRAIERQPMFVFDADIEAAFEHVNQAAVLDKLQTFPALRQAITGWLTAGVMDGGTYLPTHEGFAQGGVLSPLLMNVALHGMEAVVRGGTAPVRSLEQPVLVRYGDDFVILHSDLHELQQAARRVRQWLGKMGLQLNAPKTRITHTLTPFQGQAGLDFLSFTIRQYPAETSPPSRTVSRSPAWNVLHVVAPEKPAPGFTTVITPSEDASKRHLAVIGQRLLTLHSAPQAQVIRDLNPLIGGWAAYYREFVSTAHMSRYDDLVEQLLMKWASKRHPNKARDWLLNRYWPRVEKRGRVFVAPEGAELRTYQQTTVPQAKNRKGP